MAHFNLQIFKPALLFALFLLSFRIASGQYVEFTQITDDIPAQEHPAIYGDYVVFESEVTLDNPDLLLYQISTGITTTIVSDPSSSATNPDIYENMVVWQDNRGGDWEIYYYIIGASQEGGQPLLVWQGDQVEPAIHGDNIVFSDKKPGVTSWNIQWLQFTSGALMRLTNDTDGDQRCPDVYEDKIVWQDMRMGNWDIYMYDIGHDEFVVITDDPEPQRYPSIGKYRVVWEDHRRGDADIYMHLTKPTIYHAWDNYDWPVLLGDDGQLNSFDQTRPQIYEDNLVFMDNRNGNQEIYLYRFYNIVVGKLYRITNELADQRFPAVYDKYVVWQDERGTDGQDPYEADIWMWEFPPGADMLVVVQDEPDPVETNTELLYSLYVWNSGPQDAENALLTATLDNRVDYISVINISGGEGCSRVGNTITCDLGDMPSGTLDTVEIRVRPTTEGEITISANVQSDQDDLLPDNNNYSAKTDVLWQVYTEIGRGATPSFKLDHNNKVHVVYMSDYMEGDLLYATNAQGGWIKETLDERAYGCMLDIDPAGNIHIVYSKMNNSGQYFLLHKEKTDAGWQDAEEIDSNFMGFYNLDIDTSPSGIVYISFLENQWNDFIQLAYKKDGTWQGPNPLSVKAYNDQAMEVDANGHLHFVYYAIAGNPPGPNYYTNAPDSVWKPQVGIEPAWGGGQLETLNLDLAVDNQNNPHVSYSGAQDGDFEENHKYAVLSGGNWNYEYIEDEHWSVFNTVATDANQKAHLFYFSSDGRKLRYANNKSGSWDYKTIDFGTEDICDNEVDNLGYVHFIYSSDLELRYVTNAPEAPEPEMKLTPDVFDFVMRLVGDTTDTKKAIIENTGSADLLITEVRLAWPDSASFSIANNTCNVVQPGDSCSIDVAFNPTSIGQKTALLWVESNDPDDNVQSVRLEGLGLEPIFWDYGNTAFEDVFLGDSAINDYKILNKGNTNLQIQAVYIQEDDSEDFYYSDLPNTPFTIEEGDSVEFKLVFKPKSLGEKSTKFRIYTNDNDYLRILNGTCLEPIGPPPEISMETQAIDFSEINVGSTSDLVNIKIENKGDGNLIIHDVSIIGRDSTSFSISSNTCDLIMPGDSCEIEVAFVPDSIGEKIARLQIYSNDPVDSLLYIDLSGMALEPILFSYGNLDFGEVELGDSSTSNYIIKNVGNAILDIQTIDIEGDDASDFYYMGLPDVPFSIDPEDSVIIELVFRPGSLGEKVAQLVVSSNDIDLDSEISGVCVEPVFAVEGSAVTQNNTVVNQGKIFLFNLDANTTNYSKPISGKDTFRIVSPVVGTYTLRYDPDHEIYPGYLNTYLGDTPFYEEATQFTLDKDTSYILIRLAPVPPAPEGDGEISGNLVDEQGEGGGRIEYGRYAANGVPVEDAMVLLLNSENEIIDYDFTDASGYFEFQNIPSGSYQFYADYLFYPMDLTNDNLVLDENNKSLEIVAVVENDMISARLAETTGLLTFEQGGFTAYPIPVYNQLSVRLPEYIKDSDLKVRLINTVGQECALQNSDIHKENRILELDGLVNQLLDGVYIMVIETEDAGYYAKIIKRSR